MAKGSGSPSQKFEERHILFQAGVEDGLTPEKLMTTLGINEGQLMRHYARYSADQIEQKNGYQTVPYKSLPQKIRNLFKVDEKSNPSICITVTEDNSVILSIA